MESDKLCNIQYLGDYVEFSKNNTPIGEGGAKLIYDDGDYVIKVSRSSCKNIIQFLKELDMKNSLPGYLYEEFVGILMRKGAYPVTRQKKITSLRKNPNFSEIFKAFTQEYNYNPYRKAFIYKGIFVGDMRDSNFGLDENDKCVLIDCSILNDYEISKL